MTKPTTKAAERKAARMTYSAQHVRQAKRLALLGLSVRKMAEFFEVVPSTIERWKNEHPEFRAALLGGREGADAAIAESLYHRAKGYKHHAKKIMQYEGAAVIVDYVEHYPPDTNAATFWLRNRQPALWRADPNTDDHGAAPVPVKVTIEVKDARVRAEVEA